MIKARCPDWHRHLDTGGMHQPIKGAGTADQLFHPARNILVAQEIYDRRLMALAFQCLSGCSKPFLIASYECQYSALST